MLALGEDRGVWHPDKDINDWGRCLCMCENWADLFKDQRQTDVNYSYIGLVDLVVYAKEKRCCWTGAVLTLGVPGYCYAMVGLVRGRTATRGRKTLVNLQVQRFYIRMHVPVGTK